MYITLKRIFDIIVSLIFLILLSPLFIVIGILIKFESSGPILFKQKRLGMNESYFQIFKFRSMKLGTPNVSTDQIINPMQYITRVGKGLRKTSLDELPQLINILQGHMSFVGPRPALYNQYKLIEARKALQIDLIKPGLTGYAQIMGRDNISDAQKVEFDHFYVNHVSLLMDLKIICLTIFRVVKAENIQQ